MNIFSHENLHSFLFLLTPNREPLRRRRSICSSGTRAIGEHVRLRRMPSGSLEPPPREGAAFFGRCCFFCSLGETSLTGEWRPSICVQGRRIEVEAQRLQARSSSEPASAPIARRCTASIALPTMYTFTLQFCSGKHERYMRIYLNFHLS